MIYEDLGYESDERQCDTESFCPQGLGTCDNCGQDGSCCSPVFDVNNVAAGCFVDAVSSIPSIISHPVCVRPRNEFYYQPVQGQIITADHAVYSDKSEVHGIHEEFQTARNKCDQINRQGGTCAAIQEKEVYTEDESETIKEYTLHSGSDTIDGIGTARILQKSPDFVAWEKEPSSKFLTDPNLPAVDYNNYQSISLAKRACIENINCRGKC